MSDTVMSSLQLREALPLLAVLIYSHFNLGGESSNH